MSERSGVAASGRLHFTVGLPQSGKSTYANDWVSLADMEFNGPGDIRVIRHRVVLGGDDFRHALYGREFQIEAEGFVFASMDVAARALLRRGFDVMMDETCTTEATLTRYFRLDIDAVPHFIKTPAEVCKQRAVAAGRGYLIRPIERMAAQLAVLRANWDETVARLKTYLERRKLADVAV